MRKQLQLRITPQENAQDHVVLVKCAQAVGAAPNRITGIRRIRESIDARSRNVMIQLMVEVIVDEAYTPKTTPPPR